MIKNSKKYTTIDEYLSIFPRDIKEKLEEIRQTIKKSAPKSEEAIRYGIPTFRLNGNLVHFGAFKNHISFFPSSSPIKFFKKELSNYVISKGTIKFPLDKPLPLGLIKRIVKYRVKQSSGPKKVEMYLNKRALPRI